jgi:hypothetical protein
MGGVRLLIGLCGTAGSGKDEFAAAAASLGIVRVALADKVREVLYAMDPIVGRHPENGTCVPRRLRPFVDDVGWDQAKQFPEVRRLLQALGTEGGRGVLGADVWVNAALGVLSATPLAVVTDVRFPNEMHAIRERGGFIVRIERPGVEPPNAHISERAWRDQPVEVTVVNDGTLEQWRERARSLCQTWIAAERLMDSMAGDAVV